MIEDRNCLSYWFPKLLGAGLPVPTTKIVRTDVKLLRLLDGDTPDGIKEFEQDLVRAAEWVGCPLFLRSGHTAGKHDWRRTCYVEKPEDLLRHVVAIVEYGEQASFIGLPTKVWALRELLPVKPAFYAFEGMPVTPEWRYFIEDGNIACRHFYWPEGAILKPVDGNGAAVSDWRLRLRDLEYINRVDSELMDELARVAARRFDGAWSIDMLWSARGCFITDMAVAADSFHWEGCPHNKWNPEPPPSARAHPEGQAELRRKGDAQNL